MNDSDKALYNDKHKHLSDEFFVREDLLIAPILDPEIYNNGSQSWEGKRDVYLPDNNYWFLFVDNKKPLEAKIHGGRTVRGFGASISTDPARIPFIVPMYMRSGGILPTIEQEYYVGELNASGKQNPITFNVYPAPRRTMHYKLYLDDGISVDSAPVSGVLSPSESAEVLLAKKKGDRQHIYDSNFVLEQNNILPQNADPKAAGKYRRVLLSHILDEADPEEEKKIIFTYLREHDNYTPMEQYYFVAFLHEPHEHDPIKSVNISFQPSTGKTNVQNLNRIQQGSVSETAVVFNVSTENAYYYNPDINITFVKVFDKEARYTITANKV